MIVERGDRFSSTLFLLWVQCVVNVAFSFVAMFVNGRSGDKVCVRACVVLVNMDYADRLPNEHSFFHA